MMKQTSMFHFILFLLAWLLPWTGHSASLRDFRVNHCESCGSVLVGAAKLEPDSVQWIGAQSPTAISIAASGAFGFSGAAKYRLEPVVPNQWNFETSNSFTIGDVAPGGASPSIGFYFSPDKPGEFSKNIQYQAILPNENPLTLQVPVTGEGVADNTSDPALRLAVSVAPESISRNNVKVDGDQVKLPTGGSVVFDLTPSVDTVKLPAGIAPVQYVIVDLFAIEENTKCSNESLSFQGSPGTPNQFKADNYFQYLYEVSRDATPQTCRFQVSFLASVNRPFTFRAQNLRPTDTGYVSYTFGIRGHVDFANLQQWPGSHQTFRLTTSNEVIRTPPLAQFTTAQQGNLSVRLDASSSSAGAGGVSQYAWSSTNTAIKFSTTSGVRTEATANQAGSYPVQLTVTDSVGLTNSTTKNVTFASTTQPVGNAPTAKFSFSANPAYVGQEVILDASTSLPGTNASLVSYVWKSDMFGTLNGANQKITFNTEGEHTIVLTVTNSQNQQNTLSQTLNVLANAPQLQARFVVEPSRSGVLPYSVRLNATSSYTPPGMNIDHYQWFIDGVQIPDSLYRTVTSTGETPVTTQVPFATDQWQLDQIQDDGRNVRVTFKQPGTYGIFLKISDAVAKEASTAASEIKVVQPADPVAAFIATPGTDLQSLQLFLDASASKDPDNVDQTSGIQYYFWQWQGQSSGVSGERLAQQPAIQLGVAQADVYSLTLTVIDDDGRSAKTSEFTLGANADLVKATQIAVQYPPLGRAQLLHADGNMEFGHSQAISFRGGALLLQSGLFADPKNIIPLGSEVDIVAEVDVRSITTQHLGQAGSLIVLAGYTPINVQAGDVQFLMRANTASGLVTYIPWDKNPATLQSAKAVEISEKMRIPVYRGVLQAAGKMDIYVGYRLADGTIVFNGENPISLQIQ